MTVRYRVELSEAERAELRGLIAGGKAAVRRVKRAQILLAADAGRHDTPDRMQLPLTGIRVLDLTVYQHGPHRRSSRASAHGERRHHDRRRTGAHPAARAALGEHTEEILLEVGHSWDEIAALRAEGVVGPKPSAAEADA